jgi:predicted metal-binding membrane protein
MDNQLQHKIYIPKENAKMPAAFMICSLAFVISITITIYFCISMGGGMPMPGEWTMSMVWMRMPGETWFTLSLSFILMWLTMMVAMMIPSTLPMFLKIRRQSNLLCYTARDRIC